MKIRIDKEIVLDKEYMESDVIEVTFSKNVKYVGNMAFLNCKKLKKVLFEGDSIELGYQCFAGCRKLEEIALPKMTHIPYKCFYCSGLKKVALPANLIEIGSYAFGCCKLVELNFPNSLLSIGSYAFIWGGNLDSIDLKNVINLSNGSFMGCKIKTMSIKNYFDEIPYQCFYKCDFDYVEIKWVEHNCPTLYPLSFGGNPKMTIKICELVNCNRDSFFIDDHPYYLFYVIKPYKDMKILVPNKNERDFGEIKVEIYETEEHFGNVCKS